MSSTKKKKQTNFKQKKPFDSRKQSKDRLEEYAEKIRSEQRYKEEVST